MATTYEQAMQRAVPSWLQNPNGAAYLGALGALQDAVLARVKEAVKASFPGLAPADALPRLAADLLTPRGPSEDEATFRARLRAAIDAWRWAGTRRGVVDYALTPAGWLATAIITNRGWGDIGSGIPPDEDETRWARFWPVLLASDQGITDEGLWGDDGDWGPTDTLATWGSTATLEQVTAIRSVLRLWKSARDRVPAILLSFGTTVNVTFCDPGVFPTFEIDNDPTIGVIWFDGVD